MRAGRPREAIPHLIKGARLAVRSGAPQSAEKALSSALPSLHGEHVAEVTILLAEALQEQGRWQDSLTALESLQVGQDNTAAQQVFALAALARGYLGSYLSRGH